MEENNQILEEKKEEKRSSIKRNIIIAIMVFLGAFCAFYVVSDWYLKTTFGGIFIKFDKNFEKIITNNNKNFQKQLNVVHLEQLDNQYRISIDLSAFDNNVNNIQVKKNGRMLNIVGRTVSQTKNNKSISEFQQSYLFGDNVKLDKLAKEIDGKYYVITIPIEK